MRPIGLVLLSATLVGSMTVGAGYAPQAIASPKSVSKDAPVLWLVGTPDEDFAERVANAVEAQPDLADVASAVLDNLEASAADGNDVNLLGSTGGPADDLAAIHEAEQQVDAAEASGRVRRSGPTEFDLRGFSINNGRTWQVKTEIDGGFCASDCEVTDIIRQTWKITAQRNVDVFAFTSNYVKNAGHFSNIYADVYVYCNDSLCGNDLAGEGGARDGTGSGSQGVSHQNQANRATVDKVRLRATFDPNGQRYYDGVRTSTAQCLGGSDMYCLYH